MDIIETDEDFDGRILRVTVEVDSLKFQILTVYGPNPTEKTESEDFFDYMDHFVDPNLPVVLVGDFNMVEDLALDRQGGNPRSLHTYGWSTLEKFLSKHSLCDIWRTRNPNISRYSWSNDTMDIQSRLDRIYFPMEWVDKVKSTTISPFSWSDHDIVDVQLCYPLQ